MTLSPYNPIHINTYGLGCVRFARRYSGHRKNLLPEHNGARPDIQELLPELMPCICPERKFRLLLSFPRGTEMFHFPPYAPSYKGTRRNRVGFPIQRLPGQRLFGTSPKFIAAIPRLSSLF